LAGLGGIYADHYPVVRPLLNVRRAELRNYLKARKQPWREDLTNKNTARMRARVRQKLLPLLEKQFNSEAVTHLGNLAELARRDEAFLSALARIRCEALAHKDVHDWRIAVADLLRPLAGTLFHVENTEFEGKPLREAICSRMVRWLAKRVRTCGGELSARHVEIVMDLARSSPSGKKVQLPGGVTVRKERDALLFLARENAGARTLQDTALEYEYKIDLANGEAKVDVAELGCAFRLRVIDWSPKRGETSMDRAVPDLDRLRFPLVLRNWRPGDRLRPLGHRSAHKLKRLLNEKHVSRWERDGWPVLTSGGDLVWARGFPVAAEFAANERTQAGILIAEEKI
jgi:tRNA(Ile)-lysidine synthase